MPTLSIVPDIVTTKKKPSETIIQLLSITNRSKALQTSKFDEENLKPDSVVGTHANPVRDRAILPHLLSKFLLNPESFVRRLLEKKIYQVINSHLKVSTVNNKLMTEEEKEAIESPLLYLKDPPTTAEIG